MLMRVYKVVAGTVTTIISFDSDMLALMRKVIEAEAGRRLENGGWYHIKIWVPLICGGHRSYEGTALTMIGAFEVVIQKLDKTVNLFSPEN